jgi:phosphopantetheinyl transferase (holo-ACP synthase)
LATRDIVSSEESEIANWGRERRDHARRTISPFGRLGYYLTRSTCLERDGFVPGALPRVHLVTPAIVERTVARHGVRGILTVREQETFDAFPFEPRQAEWLAGRVAAKRAVLRALREGGDELPAYSAIDVWNDTNGAPRLTIADRPSVGGRLSLSIAHTRGAGVAAVVDRMDTGTIGVDIEPTTPVSMALIKRVMSPDERARVDSDHDCPTPLILWVSKEAAMKSASHLCSALSSIELSWIAGRCRAARVVGRDDGAYDIVVRHRTIGDYTLAVALCR